MTSEMKEDYSFQPNIIMFVSGELRRTKTKQNMLMDCFRTDGEPDLYGFDKTKLIYYDTEDGSTHMLESDDNNLVASLNITAIHTIKNSSQCKKLHMWAYYMKLIQDIYKSTPIITSKPKLIITASQLKSKTSKFKRTKLKSRSLKLGGTL